MNNIQDIVEEYKNTKSIRALSRKNKISREKVRKILVASAVQILSNDEAHILRRKHARTAFKDDIQEKAYLYSFVLGDVHICERSKFTLRAITHTTHKNFVDLFIELFERYGYVHTKYRKKYKDWSLRCDLEKNSFIFLTERAIDHLPDWINDENFTSFLAGFIDADGSIMIKKAGTHFQYVIRLYGQNIVTLREVSTKLRKLGINVSLNLTFKRGTQLKGCVRTKYNKDYYQLEIYRKEQTIKLLESLKVRHPEKKKMKELLLRVYKSNPSRWEEVRLEVKSTRRAIAQEAQQQLMQAQQGL